LRDELGFQGLVFTDDMEMKAVAERWPVPSAAVQAVGAGCDAVLVCSGNYDLQAATLEALVKAVEQEEIPYKRVEEALAHQRAAKERFLLGRLAGARTNAAAVRARLRQVVGSESHQAIAAEMARFA
jgi:beta-N-acetylhexosaminidase